MTITTSKNLKSGDDVCLMGWVHRRRDHGGLIFIDLRDHDGIVQITINTDNKDVLSVAESVRDEYVLQITGHVVNRDIHLVNKNISTGAIEVIASQIKVINQSLTTPFELYQDIEVNEELRLQYRYLDLRRPKMQKMLAMRSKFNLAIHTYMQNNGFIEIATPILANSSPEGARDYLVPSRLHKGKFFALPQAPQQFKQLLMVGGISKYYQIAPCFRDEDPRADRHPGDFYQLDCEISFATDGEEVRSALEPLIKNLINDFTDKKILLDPIPRISYQDAMNIYGSDKPDLRFDMKLIDLSTLLTNTGFSVFSSVIKNGGVIKAVKISEASSLTRKDIDGFVSSAQNEGAQGLSYLILDGSNIKSPILKFFNSEEIENLITYTNLKEGEGLFFVADTLNIANKVLGKLRLAFADHFNLRDPNVVALAWIIDFPFYEKDEKTGKIGFGHNPFSMPIGGAEALNNSDKLSILANQYDMVANGYEICSGAIRNYHPETMYKAFEVIGYDKDYVDNRFGTMISAFKYGAPPHGGCAFGLDRFFMILTDEHNIREVIAFPKNGNGQDLMMKSPSTVDEAQLKDLGL